MKQLMVAVVLITTPATAKNATLSCFTDDRQQHVVIVGNGGDVRLSWNGGPYNYGVAEIDKDYLVVQQYGNAGTFRLVYDTKSGMAYGGTQFYDGRDNRMPFKCSWQ